MSVPTTLRGKTRLIMFVAMIGLVGGLYTLARVVMLRGFSHLETASALQNMQRADGALSNDLATLERNTNEYASWDQTYRFLHNDNSAYTKSEFSISTFQQLRLNFAVISDNTGKIVFSRAADAPFAKLIPIPQDLVANFQPGSPLVEHTHVSGETLGILMLSNGPVLICSRPVFTSDGSGPVAGTLAFGRSLDAAEVEGLGQTTLLNLDVVPIEGRAQAEEYRTLRDPGAGNQPIQIRIDGRESIEARQQWLDIYGHPAFSLRLMLPRSIYQQGQETLLQFLLLLLAAGFVFGAVTLYVLEREVLSRVQDLSEHITQIGISGDPSARLKVRGKDELAFLGNAINGMLEDLERVQKDRHEGRTRLGLMIEKMPAVLWTTDAELRFTSGMGAGLETLGVTPAEMEGKSLFEYFQTQDPEFPPIAAHRKALAGQSVTYEIEWLGHVFESHVQPLRGSEGEPQGVIGVALDITDRKQLTDQLRQSQKMQAVGELAGGVAHDFNNLLMVMKGHGELLLDQLPESSPLRQNVLQAQKAAERAASLTRQLLAFSRRQVLQARVIDLNEVVGGMIQMFSRVIGENIEMAFLPGSKLSRVKVDTSQMEQVLLNLVVNARDAMPDGGRLSIETANAELDRSYAAKHAGMVPGKYVMLVVSDTGCGMDTKTQARIFEPFFTTKEPGKGTGLGLATVYGVVKQSGGFIWVYSEVGHGTTFKIYLPEVADAVEPIAAEKGAGKSHVGHETILFVEDEESVRELVSDYLKSSGYNVLEAADGLQALEMAAAFSGEIHMLVTDVVMPRLSGRELATRLAADRPHLSVLYISGYTDDSVFRHGVLEGGMSFLQKPFNLKALAQKIREVLDQRAMETALHSKLEDS